MKNHLPDEQLFQLSQVVVNQTGLHFSRERWNDLERGIRSAAGKLGYPDVKTCVRRLLSAPFDRKEMEILAGELTVGETYFFREKKSFDLLFNQIIPDLVRLRQATERRLRIWSAGCCTGEEPYSIAILLDRLLPDLRKWQITILGTDINSHFLKKASAGVYSEWSFRDAPSWLKPNYFRQIDAGHYEILPAIKERVMFSYLNLAEDNYPSLATNTNAMDLIFCRNVLMYFSPEKARGVVRNFRHSLVDKGWLLVSSTETSSELFVPFRSIQLEGMTFYRKDRVPAPAGVPTIDAQDVQTAGFSFRQPPLDFVHRKPTSWPEPMEKLSPITSDIMPDEALALINQGSDEPDAGKSGASSSEPDYALMARACANLGDLRQARAFLEKALDADKLNAGLHYLHAIILEEQGAKEEAQAALKRTLYLDPNFVLAHFSLGNCALRQRKVKEAGRHFKNTQALLATYQSDDVLPQSDGLVAGRLQIMVESAIAREQAE